MNCASASSLLVLHRLGDRGSHGHGGWDEVHGAPPGRTGDWDLQTAPWWVPLVTGVHRHLVRAEAAGCREVARLVICGGRERRGAADARGGGPRVITADGALVERVGKLIG